MAKNCLGEQAIVIGGSLAGLMTVNALAADDIEVQRLLIEVTSLCKPLSALSEEALQSRVLAEQRKHPEKYK